MAGSHPRALHALLVGLALLALPAAGGGRAPLPEEVAVRVNGQALSAQTLEWLARGARRAFPTAAPADGLLERLIEEQLLAEEAARTRGVVVTPVEQVQLELRRLRVAQRLLGREAFQRELERHSTTTRTPFSPQALQALLRPGSRPAPGQPREGPDAYDVRGARARVLLTYQLEGRAPARVTLEDVYLYARRRNTMIAEEQVRAGNRKTVEALVEELLGLRFVEWRASRGDAVGRALQELARIDRNQLLTQKLRVALGFREVHGPNAAFEQLMREVTEEEVAAWYALHQEAGAPRPSPEARWSITFRIAEEKVRARFEALRQRLRERATIEINPAHARATVQGAGR